MSVQKLAQGTVEGTLGVVRPLAGDRNRSASNFAKATLAVADVELQLIEAFGALRRCGFRSGDRPSGLRATWPDYARELGLIDQLDLHTTVRPAPPQKHEYDRMVEALGWLLLLDDGLTRKIVMARASGIGWLKIRSFARMSEPTMRKAYRLGLVALAARVNAKG